MRLVPALTRNSHVNDVGSPSCNQPLEKARNDFLKALSPEERATFTACSSPDDLIKFVQNLKSQSKKGQKRVLNRCLVVVKKLNDRLFPYFDALNVIASADKTAALAYGAFRVVLQVRSILETTCHIIQNRACLTFPIVGKLLADLLRETYLCTIATDGRISPV